MKEIDEREAERHRSKMENRKAVQDAEVAQRTDADRHRQHALAFKPAEQRADGGRAPRRRHPGVRIDR